MTIYKHTSKDRTPYTYLIGWSTHNKWYYGVRYAKKCHPSDLWVKYFTSSKHVKRFANKHGNPDIISIRKIFNSVEKALKWEQTLLKRIDVEHDIRYLNSKNCTTNTIIIEPNKTSFKKGNKPWNKGLKLKEIYSDEELKKYGRIFSDEEKINLSIKQRKRFDKPEERESQRKKTLEKFSDPDYREFHKSRCKGHSDKIWINDGKNNKRIIIEEIEKYPEWKRGRYIDKETLEKMSKSRSKDPITGKFIKKGDI